MSDIENVKALSEALMQSSKTTNKRFGNKIAKTYAKAQSSPTYPLGAVLRTENKAYKLFLKLIDDESAKKLCVIDMEVAKLQVDIKKRTGWFVNETGAQYRDNFRNMDDHEFRDCDCYYINRNEELGFYVSQNELEPNDYYNKRIRETEQRFYDNNVVILETLDNLWKEKSRIMRGNYELKNPSVENVELVQKLSDYLGYAVVETQNITK